MAISSSNSNNISSRIHRRQVNMRNGHVNVSQKSLFRLVSKVLLEKKSTEGTLAQSISMDQAAPRRVYQKDTIQRPPNLGSQLLSLLPKQVSRLLGPYAESCFHLSKKHLSAPSRMQMTSQMTWQNPVWHFNCLKYSSVGRHPIQSQT